MSRIVLTRCIVPASRIRSYPFFYPDRLFSVVSSSSQNSSGTSDGQEHNVQQQHPQKNDFPVHASFKNPIVSELWRARHESKQRVLENQKTNNLEEVKVTGRTPSQSTTQILYPFSTDAYLRETYVNPWGEMRFGRILEDLDALAGNVAFHHVDPHNPLIVTAGVDRIRLRRRPAAGGVDQVLSGQVTWVGTSSMEIRMKFHEAGKQDDEWLEAYFTFVALDPHTNKPFKINPLLPQTGEERAHFELGAHRSHAKKAARRNRIRIGEVLTDEARRIDRQAGELLKNAGLLLRMPALADGNAILMDQTEQRNVFTAQPQVRNLHDRIFGGFLMRRAFELAFATAYLFGGEKPQFLELGDVSFDAPVDVGDLITFHSRVLYTLPNGGDDIMNNYVQDHVSGRPIVVIEVEAWVVVPESGEAKVSNNFYFTFALPGKETCRQVLPSNIEQARRQAARMANDLEQAVCFIK